MDQNYNLNDVAMMTGFSTRTLRSYLSQGLLKGTKSNGVWSFSPEDLDSFFSEPFVREGLRIKRNSIVFDFMSARNEKSPRSCVILDIPCSVSEGNKISGFFCDEMKLVKDVIFSYGWSNGVCRVILNGAEDQVARIMNDYHSVSNA